MNLGIHLAAGRLPMGKLDLLPKYLLRLNQYEKFGVGIGLSTNEKLSSLIRLEGYSAYGIGDHAFKYGGGLQILFGDKRNQNIYFRYSRDVREAGSVDFYQHDALDVSAGSDSFRKMFASRMDSVERYTLEYSIQPLRYWHATLFASSEKRNPTYNYALINGLDDVRLSYQVSEVGLKFTFLFKEQIMQVGKLRVISGNSFPYVTARISKAFSDFTGSHLDFIKVDARFRHVFHSATLGKTWVQLSAGKLWGDIVPYSFLHAAPAIKPDQFGVNVYLPGYFHTMSMYEFASDEYAYLSVAQDFGPLFTAAKNIIRPELVLVQNVGYGSLRNAVQHQGIEFSTLERGYFESGMLLNNIIRQDLKLYRLGYGAGLFYRYGPYARTSTSDNVAFMVSATISF